MRFARLFATLLLVWGFSLSMTSGAGLPSPTPGANAERQLLSLLDAPLLFVKRHSYTGIHIYDTFYKWPPGGGGIYVLENPAAPRSAWKIRPVIDEHTPGTLGAGVYTHPELSWDAKRLLFCYKNEPNGNTSIYEIGIDGHGLRQVTDPTCACACYKGSKGGQHDIAPAYLPDGRIVFLSTRPSGLVPCANEGVSILHVVNADGSDLHPISVNNVNEFDPAVLPDGRIVFGRWEYVDKNALTIQSLWTVHPDGSNETALFANNMVFPEAILDARPVPNSPLVVGTLAKHNSTPRGSIAFIDPRLGKNNPAAITNLEHPDDPTFDKGDSCEPWPLSADVVLLSGRPVGQKRNRLEILARSGQRVEVLSDPDICLHSPMLVKPRPCPPVLPSTVDRRAATGKFFVQDIYQGLSGVRRGEVKWLRVIEETSRVSATPGGKQPYNQTFLVSAALAFSVKNYLGVTPVDPDGSAYFEAPSGRAVYFQALDAEGRLVHSMRTFVQAAPGTTRSCIGCHEYKYASPNARDALRMIASREPKPLQPESWGSGYVDFPSMIQPLLDKHCVRCHGGADGVAGRMDLSGGWTEHFNIAYENLANRRETQLVAYWIAGIDCMNGTAYWSSPLFAPRSHGSGAAPLAKLIMEGHSGYIPNLTRTERDLLFAWIDSNGLYHGTWDYTEHGCAIKNWKETETALTGEMKAAGCLRCHGPFESDWINLQDPARSRILRAPLAKRADGLGLGACRDRKITNDARRLRLLWNGYAHAVQPLDKFAKQELAPPATAGEPVVSFTSSADPRYQSMLAIIENAREVALASPRADMPGANVLAGACRTFNPPPLPAVAPQLTATLDADAMVRLAWEQSARTIGLEAEVHRSATANFTPSESTLLTRTTLFQYLDKAAPAGPQQYALVLVGSEKRSAPTYVSLVVPPPPPPVAPQKLTAVGGSYAIRLAWQAPRGAGLSYHIYRAPAGSSDYQRLTAEPLRMTSYVDGPAEPGKTCSYRVQAVSLRGIEGPLSDAVSATATIIKEPVFSASFAQNIDGLLDAGQVLPGKLQGGARVVDGALDLRKGGHALFEHRAQFDLQQPFSLEFRVYLDAPGKMPVIVGCGLWRNAGWFLQSIGGRWRWHVGGIDCDGGKVAVGRWIHVAATYDGQTARLFQDGLQVAERAGRVDSGLWSGGLYVGQYGAPTDPQFQVLGRIAGLKIYHRPLTAAEIEIK